MAEQTNAELTNEDLIAWAESLGDPNFTLSVPGHAKVAFRVLAERLEAAEQRAAEYAAVLEKVRAYAESIPRTRDRDINPELSNRSWLTAQDVLHVLAATAPADALRDVKADAIREYVEAARENPHTYYWPPSGVLDDAEQWADEIEKGTI